MDETLTIAIKVHNNEYNSGVRGDEASRLVVTRGRGRTRIGPT
jgi:hypothetical protein